MKKSNNLMILLGISLSLILLSHTNSHAATINAASCSYAHVSAAISAASAGDTVFVPAGSCTWTSQLAITKSITLQGAGSGTTIVNHGYAGNLISISPSSNIPIRISGIYFKSVTNNSGYTSIYINGNVGGNYGLTRIRIDNNIIEKGARGIYAHGWVYGVIDSNTFINCDICIGITGDDTYSWQRPIAAGTVHALFIEDNTFIYNNDADREPNQAIYHQQGGRTVTRFNTFDGSAYTNGNSVFYDSHGNWGTPITAYRGQPLVEVYNNTFSAHHTYLFMDIRGGSSLIYSNTFSYGSGGPPNTIQLWEEEAWTSGGPFCPACPRSTSWPAQDQINNTFIWGNTLNGSAISSVSFNNPATETLFIQKDRDYFMHAPQSTGGKTSYTGQAGGAMTFTPDGANAYYPYTPYTYPHPLRSGLTNGLTPPSNFRKSQAN